MTRTVRMTSCRIPSHNPHVPTATRIARRQSFTSPGNEFEDLWRPPLAVLLEDGEFRDADPAAPRTVDFGRVARAPDPMEFGGDSELVDPRRHDPCHSHLVTRTRRTGRYFGHQIGWYLAKYTVLFVRR